jgi:uncharacterized protein YqeY
MTIKEQLEADIKQAMLDGDKTLTTTLRTLKSAALNMEVANGTRNRGLSDEAFIELLTKEAKKRQESADMYTKGGSPDRAAAELTEKAAIEKYLPAQLADQELQAVVKAVIADLGVSGMQAMGQVIGEVKKRTAGQADGARIAATVKGSLV